MYEILGWVFGGAFCAVVLWAMIQAGLIERGLDYTNDERVEDDQLLDSVRAELRKQKDGEA